MRTTATVAQELREQKACFLLGIEEILLVVRKLEVDGGVPLHLENAIEAKPFRIPINHAQFEYNILLFLHFAVLEGHSWRLSLERSLCIIV